MTMLLIESIIILTGLAVTAVLFYRFPILPGVNKDAKSYPIISVIIPARNEENNLPLLLKDLSLQTLPAHEIICVDDASEDATANIALSYGAKLISISNKPDGWTGKTWACQKGADAAKGKLLLFLDADVRLGKDGIRRLIQTYLEFGCAISVQPYHITETLHEQLSVMFNLVQIAANGAALPKPLNVGLYGPVILISKVDYTMLGGHKCAKNSIIEDMTLGLQLKKAGIPYRLFLGDKDIAFRMYGNGLGSLFQGWTKNLAAGSLKTPMPVFFMVFLWITSLTSVPLQLIKSVISANIPYLLIYMLLYIVWVCVLAVLAKKAGRFHTLAFVFYPILLLVLLFVFTVSMFKVVFGLKVTWKGREIISREKQ